MATLTITNTFIPGTVITAAGHNQNFSDIVAWANGNIDNTNFATLTGTVTWAVTTNVQAISITNNGTEGSLLIAHNATLASGKSAAKITSNAAQSAGTAILELAASSASNAIPVLKVTDAGAGGSAFSVVSTTKPSIPSPKMTAAQRNALSSLAEGMEIYNSDTKRRELYNGSNWVDASGRTGELVAFGGASLPPDRLACDGSAVSRATYAALFAKIGTAWGVGDGSTTFNLPDLQGRGIIGTGAGSGLTSRALADSGGDENLQQHNHGVTDSGHTHFTVANAAINTQPVGSTTSITVNQVVTGGGALNGTNQLGGANTSPGLSLTSSASTGISINNSGTGSGGNMMPFKACKMAIII